MKKLDIRPLLSNKEWMDEIHQEAKERTDQQRADNNKGNKNASYAEGARNNEDARPYKRHLEDHVIGCLAERMGSILTKCRWGKERRQYSKNNRADLYPMYRGRKVRMEARGTRSSDSVIFRCYSLGQGRDFDENPHTLLFAATNLPNGFISKVGYLEFGIIQDLCRRHPEWYMEVKPGKKGNPYYWVPISFFNFYESHFIPSEE